MNRTLEALDIFLATMLVAGVVVVALAVLMGLTGAWRELSRRRR